MSSKNLHTDLEFDPLRLPHQHKLKYYFVEHSDDTANLSKFFKGIRLLILLNL